MSIFIESKKSQIIQILRNLEKEVSGIDETGLTVEKLNQLRGPLEELDVCLINLWLVET